MLTRSYCEKEYKIASSWVLTSYIASALAVFSNLLVHQLPVNFYLLALPVDDNSFNWILNYLFQLVMSISSTVYFLNYVPVTLILINHTCLTVDASLLIVEDLNAVLSDNSKPSQNSELISLSLEQIIEMTLRTMEWQKKVQSLMKFNFFVELSFLSFLFCLFIYTLSITFFGSVFILMAMTVMLSELFVYCWIGTKFKTKLEKLTVALYSVDWFAMGAGQQKDLQMILVMTQNIKGFNGVFNSLSLETFQAVSK